MGMFSQRLTLHGSSGNPETVEALVDTGALFTAVPAPILERLGVEPFRMIPIQLANGSVERWRLGQVEAELDGQRMPILCLFGSPDAPPLLGVHALEAFLLTVDPVEKKLVPKDAYMM